MRPDLLLQLRAAVTNNVYHSCAKFWCVSVTLASKTQNVCLNKSIEQKLNTDGFHCFVKLKYYPSIITKTNYIGNALPLIIYVSTNFFETINNAEGQKSFFFFLMYDSYDYQIL